jgi:hypothetical protein
MKQLYTKEPVDYILVLPASPTQLLQDWPKTATHVFSRDSPPVSCPLKPEVVSAIRRKINMRDTGSRAKANDVRDVMSTVRGTLLHSPHVSRTLHTRAFVYMR